MIQRLVLLFLFFNHFAVLKAQKIDKTLQSKIETLIKDFKGDIGIYIKNLKTGKIVQYNADTIFPTASIVKVPILLGIADKINKGALQYQQELVYTDSLFYSEDDILGSFKSGAKISLAKLMMLMLTTSDNTASLWLQKLAGTGTRINELLDSLGLKYTRINSRTPGRENNRTQYGWGQTTPKEIATLFEKIYKYELISKEACERMLRCLARNYWDAQSLSQIPPTIEVFSKNGAVNKSRSEVLIINAPRNPYLVSIFTKNNQDESWENTNEAWVLAKKISWMLWNYFEPDFGWQPDISNDKWQ